MRLGAASLKLGARIHVAMVDLGLTLEPHLGSGDRAGRRLHPWRGVVVVVLLVLGTFTVGEGGLWLIEQAVPHREYRP